MDNNPTLTCQDIDDPEYWEARLNAVDLQDCEALLDAMMGLRMRLHSKGIPTPGPDRRIAEGQAIYRCRSGEDFVPF